MFGEACNLMIGNFDEMLAAAAKRSGKRAVVISPGNEETFQAIEEARAKLGVKFALAGDRAAIEAGLRCGAGGIEILHQPDIQGAVRAAIDLVRQGGADILMKGSVDTATMMRAVLHPEAGLRTGRLLSDVFLFEYAPREGNKFVMITDGGVTPQPDLKAKVELIRNAVEVAHALGNPNPKVALLAATEFVNPDIPSTVDAALLSKMNERGQIKGCVVDGPLALDCALTPEAAAEKRLRTAVAGAAEILVCPDIECANSLAKSTMYIGNCRQAHVVVGARAPILIPSRADTSEGKLLAIALGMLQN
jgi:phosphate butyryltransferase